MAAAIAGWAVWALDPVLHELMLFAGVLLLAGGIDDLMVDGVWLLRRGAPRRFADLPPPADVGRIAVFVPAWDESGVIGAMLRAALGRYRHDDYRIYVGCYPNDRATIAAVAEVAEEDARVRLVVGGGAGPTTKADCLNTLWRALLRADAADGRRTGAVVLHDAEDVVHPDELATFARLLGEFALVQLPVLPLIDPAARLVSGHYADEFAYAHQVALPVRGVVGAGIPLAGVGCAIRRDALDALALDGPPFEAASLTEDYELGLRVAQAGGRGCFARVEAADGAGPVATRAYFPDRFDAAVRQKARWTVGIALAGWDRVGWGGWRLSEWWMRMRDRRAPAAALGLVAAYAALLGWVLSSTAHAVAGTPRPAPGEWLAVMIAVNAGLLGWRLVARALATGVVYGWREACWSLPRAFVGNVVAIAAARRAAARYVAILLGRGVRWDKTCHRFPDLTAA